MKPCVCVFTHMCMCYVLCVMRYVYVRVYKQESMRDSVRSCYILKQYIFIRHIIYLVKIRQGDIFKSRE